MPISPDDLFSPKSVNSKERSAIAELMGVIDEKLLQSRSLGKSQFIVKVYLSKQQAEECERLWNVIEANYLAVRWSSLELVRGTTGREAETYVEGVCPYLIFRR